MVGYAILISITRYFDAIKYIACLSTIVMLGYDTITDFRYKLIDFRV